MGETSSYLVKLCQNIQNYLNAKIPENHWLSGISNIFEVKSALGELGGATGGFEAVLREF